MIKKKSYLNKKIRYLQIALNSTLSEAQLILSQLPISDRILIEVGTPIIKTYGEEGIRQIKQFYEQQIFLSSQNISQDVDKNQTGQGNFFLERNVVEPYIVADLKTMDRAEEEVKIAFNGGANAAVVLGHAPIETVNSFIDCCEFFGLDAFIDMMNVEYSLSVLEKLNRLPKVVILHRGVDEEKYNKQKQLPLYEIRRLKGRYDLFVAVAGGDTLREVQSAVFNDADIVIVWKSFFKSSDDISNIASQFLEKIK